MSPRAVRPDGPLRARGVFQIPDRAEGDLAKIPEEENPNNMHIFFILFLRREKTSHLQVQTISKILLVLNIALGKNIPRAIYVYCPDLEITQDF